MRTLLRLEEIVQFISCACALYLAELPWWTYALLLLGPDIGMLGYLIGPRAGAFSYNLLHHKGMAMACIASGLYLNAITLFQPGSSWNTDLLLWTGIILFGHASMDRIFGYGLRFNDGFHHTHLGWIGRAGKE